MDGVLSAWSVWTPCSVTCGGGSKVRSRACIGPQHNGKNCTGSLYEMNNCSHTPCPSKTPFWWKQNIQSINPIHFHAIYMSSFCLNCVGACVRVNRMLGLVNHQTGESSGFFCIFVVVFLQDRKLLRSNGYKVK